MKEQTREAVFKLKCLTNEVPSNILGVLIEDPDKEWYISELLEVYQDRYCSYTGQSSMSMACIQLHKYKYVTNRTEGKRSYYKVNMIQVKKMYDIVNTINMI